MAVDYDETERAAMIGAFSTPAMGREIATQNGGQSLPSLEIVDGIVTARRCEVQRDEGRIIQKINVLAAWAGPDWFYSWEVNDRKRNRKVTVEGLSIDGSDSLARLWGNCMVDCRVVDGGDSFILYAKFVDLETGYTLIRPFMQNKAASKMQTEDEARKRDMALSMGVSKAERNVVIHALKFFAEHALQEAKKNLVGRIGKDLAGFKQRIADKLAEMEVAVDRVERIVGRPLDKWTVQDTSKIYAEVRTVADGMALADDVWPTAPPPEPKRSDVTDVPETTAAAAQSTPPDVAANGGPTPDTKTATAPPEQPSPAGQASDSSQPTVAETVDLSMPLEAWTVGDDVIGQENIIKRLDKLIAMAETRADVDAIEKQNADRISRITGVRRGTLNTALRAKRESLR